MNKYMAFITRFGFNGSPFVEACHVSRKVSYLMASNGVFDEIKIDETLDSTNSIKKESWTLDTTFLSKFQNSLEAGNIIAGGIKIQKIRFKRRKIGELSWQTMIDVPFSDDIENYDTQDFFVENTTDYEYSLVPVIQNFEGVGVTEQITTDYQSLFLTGLNSKGELCNYPLRFDLHTTDISLNFDQTIQKTLSSQYPALLCGESKYYSGNIAVKLITPTTEANGGKVDMKAEKAYREAFEDFIHGGKPMLIRNHSMYILGVLTDPKKNPAFDEEVAFGIYDYSLAFNEVNNAKDMEVLKQYGLTYDVSAS